MCKKKLIFLSKCLLLLKRFKNPFWRNDHMFIVSAVRSLFQTVIFGRQTVDLFEVARVIGKHQPQWRHQQILYRTSLNVELLYDKNNRSLLFSGSRKIPTLGPPVHWERGLPTETMGPGVGIFLSPLNTNDNKRRNQLFVWGWDRKVCPWQASWCQ